MYVEFFKFLSSPFMRYFYFSIYMYVVPIPALFLIRVYCIVYTNGVHAVFVDQIEINF